MRTTTEQSPGGGIAVVIPDALGDAAGLTPGAPVDVELAGGRLVVRPADAAAAVGPATLAELLAGITPDNLHGEWAAGPPVGREQL